MSDHPAEPVGSRGETHRPRHAPGGARKKRDRGLGQHTPPKWYRRIRPPVLRATVSWTLGSVLVLAGVAMLFLPGQGILTILAGLFVLSFEWKWARRQVARLMRLGRAMRARFRAWRERQRVCV